MAQDQPEGPLSAPSTWRARALKWIAAITAVISLILGVRQLTTWIGDTVGRRREAATQVELAKQQASRGGFAEAWKSLDRAQEFHPGDAVDAARVEIAFAWLEDARPGSGNPFSTITNAVTPALDRALVTLDGPRRADVLAHFGWATFLRSRDGSSGDPDERYQEALAVDPGNVFANTFLGHWLMWRGGNVDAARERFDRALAQAGPKRSFVRRFQLASLINRGEAADAELLRVAGEMRQGAESLSPAIADNVYWIYTMRYGPNARGSDQVRPATERASGQDGEAMAELATFEWVVATPGFADHSVEVREYVHGILQERAGATTEALTTFRNLQRTAELPPSLRDRVRSAIDRLMKGR